MTNASMPQPFPPLGRPHPGSAQMADDLRRMNINLTHIPPPFPGHEGARNRPTLYGFLLTRSKIPGKPESWERVDTKELPVTEDQLSEDIIGEKKKGRSAMAIYEHEDMNGRKREQVDRLIRDTTRDDPGFEYKLQLLKLNIGRERGNRVTTSMRIILKRQRAAKGPRHGFQELDSPTVDIINEDIQDQQHFPRPATNPFGPPPFLVDQAGRFVPDRPEMQIPPSRPVPLSPPHGSFPAHQFTPPTDGHTSGPQGFYPPRPSHNMHPQPDARILEPLHESPPHHGEPPNFYTRFEESHGSPSAEQAPTQRKKGGKAAAGDHRSKGNHVKKEKRDLHAYPDVFGFEDSDSSISEDSVFSMTGTNRTGDTEDSDPRREKRYSGDGYKSSRRSLERDRNDFDRPDQRDHVPRRRDSHRGSRGNHDFTTIRQHRRKSPLPSSNSSTSSGSRYLYEDKVYIPNGQRARRGSEYSSFDEHPTSHSRDNSYEEDRPQRRPPTYRSTRMAGYNTPVELFDPRDELAKTVQAQVKQEMYKKEVEDLRRDVDRLKEDQRHRPEPSTNERERLRDIPRSRRFSADLQSNRYHHGH